MNTMISVIMPVGDNEKEFSYIRTIQSLIETSRDDVEILFMSDGWSPNLSLFVNYPQVKVISSKNKIGQRKQGNRGAYFAKGDYIFRIDAHCKMSEDWDIKLKKACLDKTLLVCKICSLEEDLWEFKKNFYTFVSFTPFGVEKWWGSYHGDDDNLEIQSTMGLTGCGWFCKKDYYLKYLKADESLSKWGGIGLEVALKVERSKGQMFLHKGVICGHLFRSNLKGYSSQSAQDTRKKLLSEYHKELYYLAQKFRPVPLWENITTSYLKDWNNYFIYEADLCKKEEKNTKDKNGDIIRKVLKTYKSVSYVGEENPDSLEVKERITKDAKIDTIKVEEFSKKKEKWICRIYQTEREINLFNKFDLI